MKLWTGYCQSDPNSWRTQLEGFVAFNEHLSVQEVLKMGFKNFIFTQTTQAVKYKGYYSNREVEKSVPVANTVLTLPRPGRVKSFLKNKDILQNFTLVLNGVVRTGDGLEEFLCAGCPAKVECLYDPSIRGGWDKCKPRSIEGISKEISLRSDTPQAERFAMLIVAMGSDITYGKEFNGYTFKSLGKCDYSESGGFQLKTIDPLIHLYLEKEKSKGKAGSKSAITRKFHKEFCPKCFFHKSYSTYYGRAAGECLFYRSGINKRSRQFCWSSWSLRYADKQQYVKPYSFMTEDGVMRIIGGIMNKHPERTFREWIYYGSMRVKDKKGTHHYLLPDINSDFEWTGKYIMCKKLKSNDKSIKITLNQLSTYNLSQQQFSSIDEVSKKLIPVYITVLAVILNQHKDMQDVLSHSIAVFTDSARSSSRWLPLACIKADALSITVGFQYYHFTVYDFTNIQSVFERLDPHDRYYRINSQSAKYFI